MTNVVSDQLISRWSEQFRKDPLAAKIVGGLRDRSDEIWRSCGHGCERSPSVKSVESGLAERPIKSTLNFDFKW